MICIVINHKELREGLANRLATVGAEYSVIEPTSDLAISSLYAAGVTAVVVESELPTLTKAAWLDMLGSLGRRIPVFILGSGQGLEGAGASRNTELLAWIDKPDPNIFMSMLTACGCVGSGAATLPKHRVPLFNSQVPLHMLQGNGAVSLLTINANGFRKVAIEYGIEVYQKLQDCFSKVLFEMWGMAGCFRKSDMLMRRAVHSNTYYVFLEQSRISRTVPAPGVLERMADRLALRLQEALWNEIFRERAKKVLPDCIHLVPEFSVGHATALYNPCSDSVEVLEHLIESSNEISKVQHRRIRDRERELLHSIIQHKEILFPNYQAVFMLQPLTKEAVVQVHSSQSISVIKDSVYGFESLIRGRKEVASGKLMSDQLVHLDGRMLRPDILFGLAAHSKVALELDQICLKRGVSGAVELPGKLMVNILPRNLLHLERLTHLFSDRDKIIFEISESEGISNPSLMHKMRDFVAQRGCSIAADDFGKGHASIERVIKLKPELIKLDRSLVEKINLDITKRLFVEGIVKAVKQVGALILAEGVETWEEAEVVQKMGVDLIQGFLLHRPQSLETILKQIEDVAETQSVA